MRNKILATFGMCLAATGISLAQFGDYQYIRPVHGVTDQWHSLALPSDIYGKVSLDFNDIRIIEINEGDTLEVPYLVKKPKPRYEEVDFEIINTTRANGGFYYTFEVGTGQTIDEIKLDFGLPGFDFKIVLEGSQDQQEWFTIVEDYRVLSIKNDLTDYQFTTVRFPKARFGYYRLFVPGTKDPGLVSAVIRQSIASEVSYRNYEPTHMEVAQDTKEKQTVITAAFATPVPLSSLVLKVVDSVDYYRPVTVQYLKDSFKTEKGWKYNFQLLYRGTLSSLENQEFRFATTVAQQLKVVVNNHDNRPLAPTGLTGKGEVHELIARFATPGDFYLLYGHPNSSRPNYDIKNFEASIPATLKPLSLGDEGLIPHHPGQGRPLFENQWWFWLILIAIIGLLGWFSWKMMKGS